MNIEYSGEVNIVVFCFLDDAWYLGMTGIGRISFNIFVSVSLVPTTKDTPTTHNLKQ